MCYSTFRSWSKCSLIYPYFLLVQQCHSPVGHKCMIEISKSEAHTDILHQRTSKWFLISVPTQYLLVCHSFGQNKYVLRLTTLMWKHLIDISLRCPKRHANNFTVWKTWRFSYLCQTVSRLLRRRCPFPAVTGCRASSAAVDPVPRATQDKPRG